MMTTVRQQRLARAILALSGKDLVEVMSITAASVSSEAKWNRSVALINYAENLLKDLKVANGVKK